MAWRDGRSSRRHLMLFLASMVVGVAAMVAIESFRINLRTAVDDQARTLLGADMQLRTNDIFDDRTEFLIDSLGGEQAREIRFTSMVYFPETEDTRLVQIRAQEGAFPFYGELETNPAEAAIGFPNSRKALVDERLMLQFEIQPGDSLRVGDRSYSIAGGLRRIPGESAMNALFGPRVYIPLDDLDPNLLDVGSRVSRYVRFKFDESEQTDVAVEAFRAGDSDERDLQITTVEDASNSWGNALANLYGFLSLIGFMALLLGGVGVASAVNAYVREKVAFVATLRCLGAHTADTFLIFMIQAAGIGLIAAAIGAGLGLSVQVLLPRVLSDFLPVDVAAEISWTAVFLGTLIGLVTSIVFALLPLLSIRRVPALAALRSSYEEPEKWWKDKLRLTVIAAIIMAVGAYAVWTTGSVVRGTWFAAGVIVIFILLGLTARLVIWGSRKFFPTSWPYVWRQGLANLYRPNNQTTVLVLSLGLGTTLILTVYLLQFSLLGAVSDLDGRDGANTVLFDIQQDQIEAVEETIKGIGLPVNERTAIVTMRLLEVGGRSISDIRNDSTIHEKWPFVREYRSTYRSELTASETLVEGVWHGDGKFETDAETVVSLEVGIAEQLGVSVGDYMLIDVQGIAVRAEIGSLREVDWRKVSSNFFMVFEPGVLSGAPKYFVVTTRVTDDIQAAQLQRAIVQLFPNVSIIDLDLILKTAGTIIDRISFVIRFMALFCIMTGILVLIASVTVNRYQRLRESILLRTLGASTRQIMAILNIENAFLGSMAAFTGIGLAFLVSWLVTVFMFKVAYIPNWSLIPAALVVVTVLTVLFGSMGSRGAVSRPPLEVLRTDT